MSRPDRLHRAAPPRPKPRIIPPRSPAVERAVDPAERRTADARRADVQSYGDSQKLRLNARLNESERDNHNIVAGGLAGASAARFELNEQSVRNTGSMRISGNILTPPDFVDNVARDLNRIAPGTEIERRPVDAAQRQAWDARHGVDTLAVASPSPNRVTGHGQGYRLVDQLHNNPNPVSINFEPNHTLARAQTTDKGVGTPFNPNVGSPVNVSYNPDVPLALPTRQNGRVVEVPTTPAAILGHEFVHASHAQRGTFDVRPGTEGGDHLFRINRQSFRESDYKPVILGEEFRTVGFGGSRLGKEPTENSLRPELGVRNPRASYLPPVTLPGGINGYEPISRPQQFAGRAAQTAQNLGNNTLEGVRNSRNGAALGAIFGGGTSLLDGNDPQAVAIDTAIGAGSGVAEEVVQRVVNGPTAATTGMTNGALRTAASQVRGAAVAGAVINTAFTIHDEWGNLQNDATRSQAVGNIAGEAVVGAASGAAGAYAGAAAGAALGSIVPGVGTVIGGVVGFAVGAVVGYLADRGLRELGVDQMISSGVTNTYNAVSDFASHPGESIGDIADGARDLADGAIQRLSSLFG